MTVLEVIFYVIVSILVANWSAARIAFYILGKRDATIQSFKQYTAQYFGTAWNYIAFTDTVIKILAFAALISWVWQQY